MNDIAIQDQESFEQKLTSIKNAGPSNLHVIADFDRTLSKAIVDGNKVNTTYAIIRNNNYLKPDYANKAHALFDQYHEYEISDSITEDERDSKMIEWWQKHMELLMEDGMNLNVVEDIIQRHSPTMRQGAKEFFRVLYEKQVPLLIFSAGIGNLIEGFLKKEGMFYDNVHIIANFYDFDEEGNLKGYRSKIVHPFNKSEVQLTNTPYFKGIAERKNVILLGDLIADLEMTKGIEHDTILKIGFLNDRTRLALIL